MCGGKMPSYKLYYFHSRGRAELARWIFKLSGTEFEDIRYTHEEWLTKKENFPFRQLPVLEVTDDNGKTTVIPQSGAIFRFLGREFGYCGNDNLEMARTEFLCDQMMDGMMKLFITEEDEEKKKVLVRQAMEGPVLAGLKLLEGYVLDCGYFVGEKVSTADLAFAAGTEILEMFDKNILDKTPKLKALTEKVMGIPEIKGWIAIRPKTQR